MKVLEYIESTGTQYIDTGYVPDNNTRVVMDAQLTSSDSTAIWFGARTSATSNNYAFVFATSTGYYRSDYNNVYTQTWDVDLFARYIVDKNAETTTFAGSSQSYTNAAFQCPCNMTLFALNEAGEVKRNAAMKLYSCQIYDNGTLVRDYVPVLDDDGSIGLCDRLARRFYSNAGTGTFTAGPETGEIIRFCSKVTYGGETLIDLTGDTVTADKLAQGITAHDKSGAAIVGTLVASSGVRIAEGSFTGKGTGSVTISGLDFAPTRVLIYVSSTFNGSSSNSTSTRNLLFIDTGNSVIRGVNRMSNSVPYMIQSGGGFSVTLSDDGFTVTGSTDATLGSRTHRYIAFG